MQNQYVGLCLVYTLFQPLSTKLLFSKTRSQKTDKKTKLSNSIFCSVWKTEQLFIIFFSLIIPKSTLQKRSIIY